MGDISKDQSNKLGYDLKQLQVILKVAERCNIACDYCYYFYFGDESPKDRPAIMSLGVTLEIITFLRQACLELKIPRVKITFHGGEPLLQKPKRFEEQCKQFVSQLSDVTDVSFSLQTNGMLITEKWVEIFEKYQITVGVSLDGPKDVNDKHRIDHNGQGTYNRVVEGIQVYNKHTDIADDNIASLAVLDADNDYDEILDHFSNDIGLNKLAFLLPDCNHDDGIPNGHTALDYGEILCKLFDYHVNNPRITVRESQRILAHFQKYHENKKYVENLRSANQIIVLQSDGSITVDDSLIPTGEWRKNAPVGDVKKDTLLEYIKSDFFDEIYQEYSNYSEKCQECLWLNICKGGDLENRYSRKNNFKNPSVFCDGLQEYYSHVTSYLLKNGYPEKDIMDVLFA